MNHFNLGDRAKAESFIGQAEALAAPDPDVYYCIGEIYRDTDRARALEALEAHPEDASSEPRRAIQRRPPRGNAPHAAAVRGLLDPP